jgi:hypothetical protein
MRPAQDTLRIRRLDARRVFALVRKESLQAIRDPSTILIAFVLPMVLLFLFAFAVSLDIRDVRLGVVLESDAPEAQALAAAFAATRYFNVVPARDRREVEPGLINGDVHGVIVIPQDFDRRLQAAGRGPIVQVITDATQPNTASFVANYAEGVVRNWLSGRGDGLRPPVMLEPRFWFNPEVESRRFLIPGAIAIVMTMIGTLLTAMVVAREWERGTMEAVMATPASILEILLGKLAPYFGLGLVATLACAIASVLLFDVPLRGSWLGADGAERSVSGARAGSGPADLGARTQSVRRSPDRTDFRFPARAVAVRLPVRNRQHAGRDTRADDDRRGAVFRRVAAERVSRRGRLGAVRAEHAWRCFRSVLFFLPSRR